MSEHLSSQVDWWSLQSLLNRGVKSAEQHHRTTVASNWPASTESSLAASSSIQQLCCLKCTICSRQFHTQIRSISHLCKNSINHSNHPKSGMSAPVIFKHIQKSSGCNGIWIEDLQSVLYLFFAVCPSHPLHHECTIVHLSCHNSLVQGWVSEGLLSTDLRVHRKTVLSINILLHCRLKPCAASVHVLYLSNRP